MNGERRGDSEERAKISVNNGQVNAWTNSLGESWDVVPIVRGGVLSLHIIVPTEKIMCSEWLRAYSKVINLVMEGRDPEELGQCPNFHQFFLRLPL